MLLSDGVAMVGWVLILSCLCVATHFVPPPHTPCMPQRRQMEHTIATLEMKLLVKELVDTACLRAADRASERFSDRSSMRSNHSSLKVKNPS